MRAGQKLLLETHEELKSRTIQKSASGKFVAGNRVLPESGLLETEKLMLLVFCHSEPDECLAPSSRLDRCSIVTKSGKGPEL
jgi:hypothetical protein